MNPFASVATSSPVVMVRVRGPTGMFPIEKNTVACVGSVTSTIVTVMSGPSDAVVAPWAKCVNWPWTATVMNVSRWPRSGEIWRITGARVTVKAPTFAATSLPVATIASRSPAGASPAM